MIKQIRIGMIPSIFLNFGTFHSFTQHACYYDFQCFTQKRCALTLLQPHVSKTVSRKRQSCSPWPSFARFCDCRRHKWKKEIFQRFRNIQGCWKRTFNVPLAICNQKEIFSCPNSDSSRRRTRCNIFSEQRNSQFVSPTCNFHTALGKTDEFKCRYCYDFIATKGCCPVVQNDVCRFRLCVPCIHATNTILPGMKQI